MTAKGFELKATYFVNEHSTIQKHTPTTYTNTLSDIFIKENNNNNNNN